MTGNDQVRFCSHCQLNVYNFAEMTSAEAQALVAQTEGRLCGRLYRRADGMVLTKDCPVGLRALQKRVAKKAAAVFAAMVSLCAGTFGQQSTASKDKVSCIPQNGITRKDVDPKIKNPAVAGRVLDSIGAAIKGVRISIIDTQDNKTISTVSDDNGAFEFSSVPKGTYVIKFKMDGFKPHKIKNLTVDEDHQLDIQVILEPKDVTVTVGLLIMETSVLDTPPGTLIIGEGLRRL